MYILIMFVSITTQSFTSAVVEFDSKKSCLIAGTALVADTNKRATVISWGCFKKDLNAIERRE